MAGYEDNLTSFSMSLGSNTKISKQGTKKTSLTPYCRWCKSLTMMIAIQMKIKKERCHQSDGVTGIKQTTLPTRCCCNQRTAIKKIWQSSAMLQPIIWRVSGAAGYKDNLTSALLLSSIGSNIKNPQSINSATAYNTTTTVELLRRTGPWLSYSITKKRPKKSNF